MDTESLKKSLVKKFVEVTGDRLQKIQLGAIDLEKPEAAKAAEDVARELHTMKGEARMLGLSAIGQLAHAAEDLLKSHKEGKASARIATDLLLRACDAVSDLLEDPAAGITGNAVSEAMVKTLAQASGHAPPALGVSVPRPSVERPKAGAKAPGEEEAPVERRAGADRSIRVNVEILDTLGLLAGDLLVESARSKLRSGELEELLQRYSRMGDRLLRLGHALPHDDQTHQQLDRLENDLHLLRDDSFRYVRRHVDGLNTLQGSLSYLADNVAQARLVPLATVFEAFPRAVRDIAQQQDKRVDLKIDNPGVGVDRSMVNDVRDALIHLVRNAVDHGLEAPDFRSALGKPPVGRLSIRVRADGDMLHVEIEDDGRGMDPERLRASAVSKRILSQQQAAVLSDRDAIELIFLPGFSTRDEVSELSGRGVGMDVVKRKVEALGGSVAVSSKVGLGTTFHLRLPQSLALMRVLLVRLGDDIYGMPAADVEAVTRVRPEDRSEIFGTVALQHRAQPVSLVALGPLLALNGGPGHDRPPAVIVRHGSDRAALVVDGLVDEREVAVKPCGGDFLKGAPFIGGTAALEDGRIAVLLHVPDLMTEVRRMAKPVGEAQAAKRLKVLLVDDSPIARATESALVRALGHSVDEAQDGEEGYAKVLAQSYDLILSDVQMPRLDGFSFTRRIKGNPSYAKIPVIILSSLASPEDRRRGLDAGADAYLIKGELGVEILAQTIDRLT
ncbi:MAG: hybrid sensor histidine kinase/response regulator [Myxococcota bacterium]